MRGLMMAQPLLITDLIRYAARYHGDTEIVTRTVEGPVHRYNYAAAYTRIQQLAHALDELGVKPGRPAGDAGLERAPAFRAVLCDIRHRCGLPYG